MKSIIFKIRKLATEHPTLATIGLALAITFAIGAAIAMLDPQQAFARFCHECPQYCSLGGNC